MKIITTNRKAHFNYHIKETLEAGIVLSGDEIKSIRSKHVSLDDAYAVVTKGEVCLLNCYIAPYSHAYTKSDDSGRHSRKLLLHKNEVNRIVGEVSRKGVTIIPLKIYLNDRGYAKVSIGLAVYKQTHDKRQQLKDRDLKRQTMREIKQRVS
jgi:SsrA-binding protein